MALVNGDPAPYRVRQGVPEDQPRIETLDHSAFAKGDAWDPLLWAGVLKSPTTRVILFIPESRPADSVGGAAADNGAALPTIYPADNDAAPSYGGGDGGGGDVVGFVVVEKGGKIMKLGVHPAARRRGAGAALLGGALELLDRGDFKRSCLGASLHVDPENGPAVRLYERAGFARDAVVANYYAPDRPAWRMLRDRP
jgi:ribosomal protein S18 acetylase RimI-like enzyme